MNSLHIKTENCSLCRLKHKHLYNSVLSQLCQSGCKSFGIIITKLLGVGLSTEFIADFPTAGHLLAGSFQNSSLENAEIALGARNIKIIKNTLRVTNIQK